MCVYLLCFNEIQCMASYCITACRYIYILQSFSCNSLFFSFFVFWNVSCNFSYICFHYSFPTLHLNSSHVMGDFSHVIFLCCHLDFSSFSGAGSVLARTLRTYLIFHVTRAISLFSEVQVWSDLCDTNIVHPYAKSFFLLRGNVTHEMIINS